MKKIVFLLCFIACGFFIISAVLALPEMGSEVNPANTLIAPRYFEKSVSETGCRNVVSAIILSYRSYDTLAQMVLLFTALSAALLILKRESPGFCCEIFVMPSLLVKSVAITFFSLFFGFAFYILLGGRFGSGGGFQGGLLVATSFIFYSLIFGLSEVAGRIPQNLRIFFESLAILTFVFIGFLGMWLSGSFLALSPGVFGGNLAREVILMLLEISIGLSCGAILVSLFFLIKRVD